jgi:hypothetical protein
MQQLITVRAPPLPMPLPGATVCDDLQWVCIPTADSRLSTDLAVFRFSRIPHGPTENTTSHNSSIVAFVTIAVGMWHRPHRKHRVTVLLPSNGCLCWLHSSGFQQICHNIKAGGTHASSVCYFTTLSAVKTIQCRMAG